MLNVDLTVNFDVNLI